MSTRIRFEDLPESVRESLEHGESVEVERDGLVVGSMQIQPGFKGGGLRALVEDWAKLGPLGDDYWNDVLEHRRMMNVPPRPTPWES
jgi:hypothetical protein